MKTTEEKTEAVLQLLGPPFGEHGAHRADLPTDATLWLLTFLACHDEPVNRSELLSLLYPETEEGVARNRLRNLLHRVRHLDWMPAGAEVGLEASGPLLHWTAGADVRAFRRACLAANWSAALELYRGPLLAGRHPDGLPAFEDWLAAERDNLQQGWLEAVFYHASELEQLGRAAEALSWSERLLALSPYSEGAVQTALRCALALGDRHRAGQIYLRHRQQLQHDLGLEPAADTTRLYQAALATSVQAPVPARSPTGSQPHRRGRSAIFGRQDELNWICERLQQPGERLLTLVGPGGAGKTRLSLAVLAERDPCLAAFFVPLVAVTSVEMVISSMASILGLAPGGGDSSEQQVCSVLQTAPHLLVLDNLEHLLASPQRGGVLTLLTDLLDQAPSLRLLVTSRVRLGLQAEQILTLGGLDYPSDNLLDSAARSGAVRLFTERASRVRPDFALNAQNMGDLIRICELTEALPLALELCATWMGTFEPRDLVEELTTGFDLLESGAPDRPERHHSLRATFEHSWRLLSSEEQQALARLSVFRGGFERQAALAITGTGLRPLLTLADHSLIRRDLTGRYSLHEMIRQYASECLQIRPEEESWARAAHGRWYAALATEAEAFLHGPDQTSWLGRLQTEHDNLRSALAWSLAEDDPASALRMTVALHWFWYVRGLHREGQQWLKATLALDGGSDAERARALSRMGGLASALGEYDEAQRALEAARTIARRCSDLALEAEAIHGLGLICRERGQLEEARALFEQAETLQRPLTDPWALASTLNDLGIVWCFEGQMDRARPLFQESLRLKEQIGDRQGVAYALANLGNTMDDLEEYQQLIEQSLVIKREIGDRQGIANSLFNLSDLHLNHGQLDAARLELHEALSLYWQLGRRRSVAAALTGYAKLLEHEGESAACLRLCGAADAMLESIGVPAQGFGQGSFQDDARTSIGPAADELYRLGRIMTAEQAVSQALGTQRVNSRHPH